MSETEETIELSDTKRAMQTAPDYWLNWYTFKSLALVAAVGGLGYMLGKSKAKKELRDE